MVVYVQYGMSFFDEILRYLFDTSDGHMLVWHTRTCGQYTVSGQLPYMTSKGADMVASMVTMMHNSMVFLAQLSTLLPANGLD